MLWIRALHIIFMVTWFAGVFYLPRLFVYHADAQDEVSHARFVTMERRLFWIIMTPGALLTIAFGVALLYGYAWALYKSAGWLHAKLTLVALLVGYHVFCGKLMHDFAQRRNTRSARFFRIMNEVPTLVLFGVVILVVVKPF